eukprot:m.160208 g.160208  ORF g.160208 m.160208 type:complete len:285 (+) comp18015_c0_seq2:1320-2174(+)
MLFHQSYLHSIDVVSIRRARNLFIWFSGHSSRSTHLICRRHLCLSGLVLTMYGHCGDRSGSTFHVDPNGTSAWNAVISGAKKWILLPPHVTPPGVHPSDDGSEVTSPVSIGEWFLNYYDQLREMHPPPVECIAKAGDLVFVPSGWWHCVLNLDATDVAKVSNDRECIPPGRNPVVAITQNYVSSANLRTVCAFLKHKRSQVSGCRGGDNGTDLFERFTKQLCATRPDLCSIVSSINADGNEESAEAVNRSSSLWDSMRAGDTGGHTATPHGDEAAPTTTFSFGF